MIHFESRLDDRRELACSVQLACADRVLAATGCDLSMSGIGLRLEESVELGKRVKLFVALDSDSTFGRLELLVLDAVPLWQEAGRVGLRFVELDSERQALLRQHLC
jgi:hypothetical protein